jgi:predicted MFS family arabinose efflux permease
VTPAVGRVSDRRGRIVPLRAGLVATIVLLVCFTVPSTELGLALLIVALTTSVGAFWAPAMAMQSDAAETQHLDQALAAALMNLAWAAGVTIGEVGAGAIAKSAGDQLPMLLLAGVCGVTLAALVPRRSVQRTAGKVPDAPAMSPVRGSDSSGA